MKGSIDYFDYLKLIYQFNHDCIQDLTPLKNGFLNLWLSVLRMTILNLTFINRKSKLDYYGFSYFCPFM